MFYVGIQNVILFFQIFVFQKTVPLEVHLMFTVLILFFEDMLFCYILRKLMLDVD